MSVAAVVANDAATSLQRSQRESHRVFARVRNTQVSRTGLKQSEGGILFQLDVFNLESSDKIVDHVF